MIDIDEVNRKHEEAELRRSKIHRSHLVRRRNIAHYQDEGLGAGPAVGCASARARASAARQSGDQPSRTMIQPVGGFRRPAAIFRLMAL